MATKMELNFFSKNLKKVPDNTDTVQSDYSEQVKNHDKVIISHKIIKLLPNSLNLLWL